MRSRVVVEVAKLTFREFMRTPSAVFWTYGFPLVMALSLGFAFRTSEPPPLSIAVVSADFGPQQLAALRANPRLDPELLTAKKAEEGYRGGRFLLVLSGGTDGITVKLDQTRPGSELARLQVEKTLRDAGQEAPAGESIHAVHETTPGWRYIDWLIPGLIGLNLLGAGLWGVGFNLVQMRVKNILRRLMVTPMHRSEFLTAFLLSRLVLVVPESAMILGFGHFVFGVPVSGSLVTVFGLVMLGAVAFTGLGMLVASRVQTIETVSGMMNLVMLPMWVLGGCFFSNDKFPAILVDVLPISHFNVALRAVMSDGKGVLEILPQVGFLAGFGVLTMGLAIRCFRWS